MPQKTTIQLSPRGYTPDIMLWYSVHHEWLSSVLEVRGRTAVTTEALGELGDLEGFRDVEGGDEVHDHFLVLAVLPNMAPPLVWGQS